MVELQDVHIAYKGHSVFEGVNLKVANGEVCCIRTGVLDGGSSLLKCCAGLVDVDSGNVILGGKDINEYQSDDLFKKVSYCYEQGGFVSIFSNFNNIAFPIGYHLDVNQQAISERIINVAEQLGIAAYLQKEPHQLNDVQLKLFNLARALVIQPDVILIDELQAGMSLDMRQMVIEAILEQRDKYNHTIIMTTTAGDDVSFANQVLSIKDKQLMVEQQ